MDVTTIAATAAITALVSGVVGAIVATLVSMAKDSHKQATDVDKAMMDGMRVLLWRELKTFHSDAVANGGLTTEERKSLDDVYSAYHAMGGNGTGTRLYEEAMETRVL